MFELLVLNVKEEVSLKMMDTGTRETTEDSSARRKEENEVIVKQEKSAEVTEIEMANTRETEPTSVPTTEDLKEPMLGIIQTLLLKVFQFFKAPPNYATSLNIIISLILSLSDGVSDLGLHSTLNTHTSHCTGDNTIIC